MVEERKNEHREEENEEKATGLSHRTASTKKKNTVVCEATASGVGGHPTTERLTERVLEQDTEP